MSTVIDRVPVTRWSQALQEGDIVVSLDGVEIEPRTIEKISPSIVPGNIMLTLNSVVADIEVHVYSGSHEDIGVQRERKPIKARHSFAECLRLTGWYRNDMPWRIEDDPDYQSGPGECTDTSGCIRPGRWTHPYVSGELCAAHAHQATTGRRWGIHS